LALQHWESTMQPPPSGVHFGGPQMPPLHWLLQQGAPGLQAKPSGMHIGLPQRPLGPQICEQHWSGALHGVPSGWQGPPHTLLLQMPLQQFEGTMHAPPLGVHIVPPQTPLPQICEQHCDGSMHGVPFGLQLFWKQTPLAQRWLQHSALPAQGLPSGSHMDPSGGAS
jgi:hypothetical protein